MMDDDKDHSLLKNEQGYTWEEKYKRSWDIIQENRDGVINTKLLQEQKQWRKRRERVDDKPIKRGILRHLTIVLDMSVASGCKDLKPSYLELSVSYLRQFFIEFFDQNPISQVSIVTTKDGVAMQECEFTGNLMLLNKTLDDLNDSAMLKGEPSLQNALELSIVSLSHTPVHGSREVLVIFSSLLTRDPGDIHSIIPSLQQNNIRVSFISLSSEVQICKEISKRSNGTHFVPLNEDHYKDILFELVIPPAIISNVQASLVFMGFPARVDRKSSISLCACHQKPTTLGFICPRCNSKQCTVPSDCSVCELKLISGPHLARSYHHLFPVATFNETTLEEQQRCFGCQSYLIDKSTSKIKLEGRCLKCSKCTQLFCLDCDKFIHEILHSCPGCN